MANMRFLPFHVTVLVHNMKIFFFSMLWCLLPIGTAGATEGGGSNYLPGFYGDFGMAEFPERGTFFNNFFAAYQDTESKTGTLLEMPGIMHVSQQHFLNGTYVSGLFPALMVAKDHSSGIDRVGLGDFYFVPGGLNWKWEGITAFLFEGIVAPTGYYRANEFSLGRNYWTFDHNLLLTWRLPGDNELSVGMGYMNNLKNPATNYQSGDELHFDYTVGHYVNSTVALGVAGSYYKQMSRDTAPQEMIVNEPGESASIGPVVMYTPKINGQDVAFSLKWLREFNVSGRLSQEYLVCRILLSF